MILLVLLVAIVFIVSKLHLRDVVRAYYAIAVPRCSVYYEAQARPYDPHNLAIVSAHTPSTCEYAQLTRSNMQKYASRHGYTFHYTDTQDFRPLGWWSVYFSKIKYMLDVMRQEKHDYVVWLDSDVMVLQPGTPIHKVLDLHQDVDLHISTDPPQCSSVICNGTFCIRNTPLTRFYMDQVHASRFLKPFQEWPPELKSMYVHLLMYSKDLKTKIYPNRVFNAHPETSYKPGDFLIHSMGMSSEKRLQIFKHHAIKG